MSVDSIHAVIALAFCALWAIISLFAYRGEDVTGESAKTQPPASLRRRQTTPPALPS